MRNALFIVSVILVLILPVSAEEETLPMAQSIEDGRLIVTASTNPNSSYEFVQNGTTWELDLSTLPDGKHTITLQSEGEKQLAIFWTGAQSEFVWEDALIQMVMVDRFVNGNTSNDGVSSGSSHEADWLGGDLQGVTKMIESGYFENLGINAIWLSPLNTNPNGSYLARDGVHQVSGYHGYWPIEPRQVDPRFGGEEALDELVKAAHSRGMRVMADFIINHVHEDHVYFQDNPGWFNEGCLCGTSGCEWTERRLDCLFMTYMPDIDWNNEEASEQMVSDALWWIERFDLDGLRIDAVKHVDDKAITALSTAIKQRFEGTGNDFYLKGETAMGWAGHSLEDNQEQYATINRYMSQEGLDGQADFVLYHAVVDNVFSNQHMDYMHLDYWTNRSQDQYVQGAVMTPYIGSHDTPRLISRIENDGTQWNQWADQVTPGIPSDWAYARIEQAIGWLLTTPGAPVIYMGDEFGMHGGADPDNRRMLDFNLTQQQQDLYDFTASLGKFRLDNEALRRGTYSTYYADTNLLAYEMISEEQELLVVLNRGGSMTLNLEYDRVLLGEATLRGNDVVIPAFSVNILGHDSAPDDTQAIGEEEPGGFDAGSVPQDNEKSGSTSSITLQNGLIILIFILLALLVQTMRKS